MTSPEVASEGRDHPSLQTHAIKVTSISTLVQADILAKLFGFVGNVADLVVYPR